MAVDPGAVRGGLVSGNHIGDDDGIGLIAVDTTTVTRCDVPGDEITDDQRG